MNASCAVLCLLLYAGLSLFIIGGPYIYMVVCIVYAYNLTFLSMFLSVQAITFEPLDIETLFSVCRYILTISSELWVSRSLGQGQGHMRKNYSFTYFNLLSLCMFPKVINKVKVTHQGKGHIKVKIKYLHPFQFFIAPTLRKRAVCIQLKCYLFL